MNIEKEVEELRKHMQMVPASKSHIATKPYIWYPGEDVDKFIEQVRKINLKGELHGNKNNI